MRKSVHLVGLSHVHASRCMVQRRQNYTYNPKHVHQGLTRNGNDDGIDDSIEMCQSVLRHPVGLYDLSFCTDVKLGMWP